MNHSDFYLVSNVNSKLHSSSVKFEMTIWLENINDTQVLKLSCDK